MAKKKLSHYDSSGRASMVDVSEKKATKREAEASAQVIMSKAVFEGVAAESQGRSAGSRAHRGHTGGEAHFGANPNVPPSAALAR